jgi:hypothetical protein
MYLLTKSVTLRKLNKKYDVWNVDQFIERWNIPVKRIPHYEHCFTVCSHSYCWLNAMSQYHRNSCRGVEHPNQRYPSCRCQVSGVSVSGRQIFPREAVWYVQCPFNTTLSKSETKEPNRYLRFIKFWKQSKDSRRLWVMLSFANKILKSGH